MKKHTPQKLIMKEYQVGDLNIYQGLTNWVHGEETDLKLPQTWIIQISRLGHTIKFLLTKLVKWVRTWLEFWEVK